MAESSMTQNSMLLQITQNSTLIMGIGVIGVLIVMMVPLPTIVLDLLLSFNLTLSIIILLMSMYVLKPLDFSVFPSILLTSTLLRLSLNVASTRLILLHGNEGAGAAGKVIMAFGTFVVGGNFVVGLIVFLVLVLINFVVITKGATRVAEVSARFTLDAMPGKQMSIDADLNTGLITEIGARQRRQEIEQEANFYGAMDGASKFVRGDAVAGIIIVMINIIGGLVVGVLQQGMEVADAARNFTLLTVGDGLVSQVPALIVSTAAGILVTRTTASSDLGLAFKKQLFMHPKAVATASLMLFSFALIPGMPKFSFILVAALAGGLAFKLFKTKPVPEDIEEAPAVSETPAEEMLAPLDSLGLEVGYGLISLVDAEQGGELLARVKMLRKQLAQEIGFVMPAIHIRDNLKLRPNAYSVFLKGIEITTGELMPGHYLAIASDDSDFKLKGVTTREPAFGLPAVWIPEKEKESAQARGIVVVDAATVITTHLTELVKSHADELLGRQEVQSLIDNLSSTHPKVIAELVPKLVPLGTLQKVLHRLLRERVAIRDLLTILETLADYLPITKNADILTGYVRQALSRTITRQHQAPDGDVHVAVISPDIESRISESVHHTEFESFVSPDPNMIQGLVRKLQPMMTNFSAQGLPPVVLCSPNIRIHLRKLLEKFFPNLAVLSHNEIAREVNIRSLGMVEL